MENGEESGLNHTWISLDHWVQTGNNIIRVKQVINIDKSRPNKTVKFELLNAQSLRNKECVLHDHLTHTNLDFAVIMKTICDSESLSDSDADKVWLHACDMSTQNYKISSINHKNCCGGSFSISRYKESHDIEIVESGEKDQLEYAKWKFR